MTKIKQIIGREIIDSRGFPTVETEVILENGISARASVPSGASKGVHEALEKRDGDVSRFQGKGVLSCLKIIKEIINPLLVGLDVTNQNLIDRKMIEGDGTENKTNFGANSILSVSLACCRAGAVTEQIPLYKYIAKIGGYKLNYHPVTPMFNVINGGLHGSTPINFQEFMIVPNMKSEYSEKYRAGVEIYQNLKKLLKTKGMDTAVGDEGGFSPHLSSNTLALDLLKEAIVSCGYEFLQDVSLSMDLASSTFYENGRYRLTKNEDSVSENYFVKYLSDIIIKYRILTIEDLFPEDAWEAWKNFTQKNGSKIIVIGDDLLVTNPIRLKKAISEKSCNAILIKVNQIGTLTETLEVIEMAKNADFETIISHRSGETNDDFIADLAVGVNSTYVKFGAPARGERVAKYNRLQQIYRETGN